MADCPHAGVCLSSSTETNVRGWLFSLIQAMHPALASKITGMLLEIDKLELRRMLDSPECLPTKVDEATAVLQAHQAKETSQQAVSSVSSA